MKKIRWFFAEYFVVVSGVLVAFILNSWWLSIKEQDREKAYLRQIYQDLSATITYVEKAQKEERARTHAGAQFVRSLHSDTLIADSTYVKWTFTLMSYSPGEKVSTTLSSLMTTGDIQLVGNDSLRTGLVTTTEKLNEYNKNTSTIGCEWLLPNFDELSEKVEATRMVLASADEKRMEGASRDSLNFVPHPQNFIRPEPLDWAGLTKDKEFRHELFYSYIGHRNMLGAHSEILEQLGLLEAALKAELKDRDLWRDDMAQGKATPED
jgi:hypothetical protein